MEVREVTLPLAKHTFPIYVSVGPGIIVKRTCCSLDEIESALRVATTIVLDSIRENNLSIEEVIEGKRQAGDVNGG